MFLYCLGFLLIALVLFISVSASSYKAYYPVFLIRRKLIESYLATNDVESFTTILRQVASGIRWKALRAEGTSQAEEEEEEGQSEEETAIPEYRESIGHVVLEVVKQLKNKTDGAHEIERIFQVNIFTNEWECVVYRVSITIKLYFNSLY